jgi:hypothetical protein
MVEGAGAAEAAGAHGWTARGRGRYAGVVIWYAEGAFCSGGLGFWYTWEKYFSELATFAGFPCYIDIVQ